MTNLARKLEENSELHSKHLLLKKVFKIVLFLQHDQLYTWAAVNQPPHSLDLLEGKLAGQLKTQWSPVRLGENRTGHKSMGAGKLNIQMKYEEIKIVLFSTSSN